MVTATNSSAVIVPRDLEHEWLRLPNTVRATLYWLAAATRHPLVVTSIYRPEPAHSHAVFQAVDAVFLYGDNPYFRQMSPRMTESLSLLSTLYLAAKVSPVPAALFVESDHFHVETLSQSGLWLFSTVNTNYRNDAVIADAQREGLIVPSSNNFGRRVRLLAS
jgi:hypothetical protein